MRQGFSSWVGKILWRRVWQPTLVFLPGESHGQQPWSLEGYSPQVHKEQDTNEVTQQAHTYKYHIDFISITLEVCLSIDMFSALAYSFKSALSVLELWFFHMIFRVSSLTFIKTCQDTGWYCTEYINYWGKTDTFMLGSLTEKWYIPHQLDLKTFKEVLLFSPLYYHFSLMF